MLAPDAEIIGDTLKLFVFSFIYYKLALIVYQGKVLRFFRSKLLLYSARVFEVLTTFVVIVRISEKPSCIQNHLKKGLLEPGQQPFGRSSKTRVPNGQKPQPLLEKVLRAQRNGQNGREHLQSFL